MEFVSSETSETALREHQALLHDISEQLGVPPSNATAIPPEVAKAVRHHIQLRRTAFSVVQPDMVAYSGDPLTYLDPSLVERAAEINLLDSEIDVDALFAKFPSPSPFGAKMKADHFHLIATQVFLNTGSYGATPKAVVDARHEWEGIETADPFAFRNTVLPVRLRQAMNRLAKFVNAHPADLSLMVNCNSATSTILKSMPWEVGDALLLLSIDYDATKLAAKYLEQRHGVEPLYMDVTLPLSHEEICRSLKDFLGLRRRQKLSMPKLANFCHVTSKTGWIFPVKRMTEICHDFGIPVIVDGAQVPGHIPLDVMDINAEYYFGTCHKWMLTCQGVAFLVTAPSKQSVIRPLAPVGGYSETYQAAFIGSQAHDYTPFLSLLQAFDFVDRVCGSWEAIWGYCGGLAQRAVRELTQMWGLEKEGLECVQTPQVFPTRKGEPVNCLPIVPLPRSRNATEADAKRVMGYLLTRCNITAFLLVADFRVADQILPLLCVRLSCNVHVCIEDIRKLGKAVNDMKGTYESSLGDAKEYMPEDQIQVS